MFASSWGWIIAANILLGINQGFAWSMTSINELAGYLAVGLTTFGTGYLASLYELRPVPFYLGAGTVMVYPTYWLQ